MQEYVYDPPAGSPPFEFMFNGGPIAVQPPDQFWMRTTERKRIGVKLDAFGNVSREVFRDHPKWVEDAERNAAMLESGHRPTNTIWLTKGKYKAAMAGQYQPLNKYLKPVKDLDKALRKSTAERQSEHEAYLDKMRKQHEIEKQRLHDVMMREIQEMNASYRATLQKVADEVGVKVELLESALMKQREQTQAGKITKGREERREGREVLENQPKPK